MMPVPMPLEATFLAMFRDEWRLARWRDRHSR
jgi:hypothetical protein